MRVMLAKSNTDRLCYPGAPRLLNDRGEPTFNINFYIVNRKGEYAGVAMYSPERNRARFAVCDEKGARHEMSEPLLPGAPTD